MLFMIVLSAGPYQKRERVRVLYGNWTLLLPCNHFFLTFPPSLPIISYHIIFTQLHSNSLPSRDKAMPNMISMHAHSLSLIHHCYVNNKLHPKLWVARWPNIRVWNQSNLQNQVILLVKSQNLGPKDSALGCEYQGGGLFIEWPKWCARVTMK